MYFHFFYGENGYSKALLQLLENHVDVEKHIVVFGFYKSQSKSSRYSGKMNKKSLRNFKDFLFVLKNIKNAKWIYIHFLQYNPTLLYWALNERLLKKSTWVVWGSDIYSYYKRKASFRTRFYEVLRRKIIANLPEIAAFVAEDFELIQNLYKTDAEYIPILYPIPVDVELLDQVKIDENRCKTVFLIGNSGDKSNNHFEMIELLAPFRNENIEVVCPLSYGGTKEYREQVAEIGKEKFGEKFLLLSEYMNAEKYSQVLGSVDVALMNHKRQQGLGNILALLYLGKKVFLRSDITSFAFFKRQECYVFEIEKINKMTFEQLIEKPNELMENKDIVKRIISEENYLKLWLDLLDKHA